MTDLSPAAQAVNRDLAQIMQELSKYCRVSISATDVLPITLETNDTSLEAAINTLCAAALRAAADEIDAPLSITHVPEQQQRWYGLGVANFRRKLLAIAAELEGQQ